MFSPHPQPGEQSSPFAAAQNHMIEQQLRARGIVSHSVLEAMRTIPRHLFVSHQFSHRAYADEALPSLDNQTISQPYIVAVMTQELQLKPGLSVLELGTGTGYQTAILGHLVAPGNVFTIERAPSLASAARRRLDAMQINNVRYVTGDGSNGWPVEGPDASQFHGPRSPTNQPLFDRILVTAGVPEIPKPLLAQLAPRGILIAPVGRSNSQTLVRLEQSPAAAENSVAADPRATPILECRFVPLLGDHAWNAANYEKPQTEEQ